MNLLLLEAGQVDDAGGAVIEGPPLAHVINVLGKGVGDTLRVGVIGGLVGRATVTSLTTARAELACTLDTEPPRPSPVRLVLALPRPPMLRRLLAAATALGVKQIHLIQSARVDKSYWGTPSLTEAKVGEQLRLGLAQAVDTSLPEVHMHRRFRPFVEDHLPPLAGDGARLVADLVPNARPLRAAVGPVTLAVGPEGGWVDFERERFAAAGFCAVGLGPRVLRVETAVVALLARLG